MIRLFRRLFTRPQPSGAVLMDWPTFDASARRTGPSSAQVAWMREHLRGFAEAQDRARRVETERDLSERIAKGPNSRDVLPAPTPTAPPRVGANT